MGRILTHVVVSNTIDPSKQISFKALVDTGAYGLTLPLSWKASLGTLADVQPIDVELADERVVAGEIAGPVTIELDGFRRVSGEVIFLPTETDDGEFEPLVGYMVLEAANVIVDMLHHRLVKRAHYDVKPALVR